RRSGVSEVRTIELQVTPTPAPAGTRGMRAPNGDDALLLEVPPPAEGAEQVVLLVDEAGAVSWHFPLEGDTNAVEPPTRRGAGGRTQTFRIPSTVAPAPRVPARGTRGVIGTIGRKVMKVLVYPITDPIIGPLSEHFARKWEDKNRPYGLRLFGPEDYTTPAAPALGADDWRRLGAGRALLFIHGTFSTAHAAFGTLPRYVLSELGGHYEGRVFAFNHHSLSDDPRTNAEWFFRQVPPGVRLDVDIICHSRGGLVARQLSERAAVLGGRDFRVGKVVFVGVPNAGTALAAPDHMVQMIDRFTSVLNIFPTGLVTETLEAIVTAVKVIGHGALKGLDGLASMNPSGAFLGALRAGRDRSGATYFAVAADYEPAGGPLAALVTKQGVADAALDRIFDAEPNDLVVPTGGVYAEGAGPDFPIPDERRLAFGAAAGVIHTTYFARPEMAAKLREWLLGGAEVDALALAHEAAHATRGRPPQPPQVALQPPEPPPEPVVRTRGGLRGGPRPDEAVPAPPAPAPEAPRTRGGLRGATAAPPQPAAPPYAPPAPSALPAAASAGGAPAADEGTSITRHPSIAAPAGGPVPGEAFEVTVDLRRQQDEATSGGPVGFAGLAADWRELPVTVQLSAPDVEFDGGGTIVVRRNADSTPCTVRGRVKADTTSGEIEVAAVFFHRGRYSGVATRAFPVRAAGGGGGGAPPAGAASTGATTGAFDASTNDAPPMLTVYVSRAGKDQNGGQVNRWQLTLRTRRVPGLPPSLAEDCAIGQPGEFVQTLLAQYTGITPGAHLALFEGAGTLLWEKTPASFKQTYWALRDHFGPGFEIQFVSDDPDIPWELMCPLDAEGNSAGLLALEHPVGRWILSYEGTMPRTLPAAGEIVTIAPDYAARRPAVDALQAAAEEARMLEVEFRARRVQPADKRSVLGELTTPRSPVSVLHFAGHGKFDGAANARVLLSDDDLLVLEVRAPATKLGREYHPFVVFNACEVGRQGALLGNVGGWAEAFMRSRFGGFLAPLWPVYDTDAHVVMEEFFEGAVRQRRPVAEVVREIRRTHAAESPTFLSYIYYGDVMARFG
ncbi:MAG TPA: CHAT domain-containing protein, partial [Gemmatimonadaceae bacterium]|nr:CHAT domain-containing protein [Gemmatimonadaceae bacterium]